MALVEFLQGSEIESSESVNVTADFITNTIRNIFFTASSAAVGKESEIDKRLKQITLAEVADHDCYDDCWIIIYDRVYDLTKFLRSVSPCIICRKKLSCALWGYHLRGPSKTSPVLEKKVILMQGLSVRVSDCSTAILSLGEAPKQWSLKKAPKGDDRKPNRTD